MKIVSSLKTARSRHAKCKMVRRRGKIFIINKEVPKFKARMR